MRTPEELAAIAEAILTGRLFSEHSIDGYSAAVAVRYTIVGTTPNGDLITRRSQSGRSARWWANFVFSTKKATAWWIVVAETKYYYQGDLHYDNE